MDSCKNLATALLTFGAMLNGSNADVAAQTPKQELDQLLGAYKAYGLPLPPADAPLVRYLAYKEYTDMGVRHPARYWLAFQVKSETKGEKFDLLIGLSRWPASVFDELMIVEPKPAVLERVDPTWDDLILAIQFHARGWRELALGLFKRCIMDSDKAAATELALAAWQHWTLDLSSPHVDWSKLAPQLKVILDREPKSFDEHHRSLLRSMELALQPSKAKPGSIDALIDGLIDADLKTSPVYHWKKNPRYLELGMRGFEVVPTLIAHLDDERLTRTKQLGFNNFPGFQYRIQHSVSDLLQDLAGNDVGKDWLRRLQGYAVDKAAAEAWWKETQAMGEEAYFAKHVLGEKADTQWPQSLMLKIIAKKYPRRLKGLYSKMLAERPNMVGWPVADAVVESKLPLEERREILLMVAAAKNLDHRCDALGKLKDIDPPAFHVILVATLDEMAKPPNESNLRYAHLVQETTNANVWAALKIATERASPGVRLEYLSTMQAYEDRKPVKKHQLQFLAHFLEDAAEGHHRWSGFTLLEVRNMAAWSIVGILNLDDRPEPTWTDTQWAALRKKAKAALERAENK